MERKPAAREFGDPKALVRWSPLWLALAPLAILAPLARLTHRSDAALLLFAYVFMGILAVIVRRAWIARRARRAFAHPEATLAGAQRGQPTRVNVRRVDGPNGAPLLLLTDPEAREVIGFVEDPDMEVWSTRRGRPNTRLRMEELWSEEGALIVGSPIPTPLEDLPPALHAALHGNYREPPAALRWSATPDTPLRLLVERS